MNAITQQTLHQLGIAPHLTEKLAVEINTLLTTQPPEAAWKLFSTLLTPNLPFALHLQLFTHCYPKWRELPHTAAAWFPDETTQQQSHLAQCMAEKQFTSIREFQQWSSLNPADFWEMMINKLKIKFSIPPKKIVDKSDLENPQWLIGAKFNIAESCLQANPEKFALIQHKKSGIRFVTYAELTKLSNQIANSLLNLGFGMGDALAINLPMHEYAVAIYLGILKIGAIIVSIADSFSPTEIAARLRIAKAKAIFTQDTLLRNGKTIALYEKIIAANAPTAIVLTNEETLTIPLRQNDIAWQDFLVTNENFQSYPCTAMTPCNILFSSGTTGDPKAIPWTHATAIKAANDAYLHQDIHSDDILAWPTNLGWMMGPWLIFAGLINHATIALYDDAPTTREFGEFIQHAKVTMLGVVPTLVATWRQSNCMHNLNWQSIKCFSSTGECSNPEDMLYLMSLAGYKPIIEYCGGTEIGGAYISSTLLENNYPAVFTTPAMGLDFVLLDETGKITDNGEVALIPPSIGLSNQLLNVDHHKTYFANMPKSPTGKVLRRHGDQIQCLAPSRWCILGRADDTMNLGGIKVSSAEIERVLAGTENIIETAAIAITLNQQGPSQLVIFVVSHKKLEKEAVQKALQAKINQYLNPLFKIYDIVLVNELPKTASNKIMRRTLRKQYR